MTTAKVLDYLSYWGQVPERPRCADGVFVLPDVQLCSSGISVWSWYPHSGRVRLRCIVETNILDNTDLLKYYVTTEVDTLKPAVMWEIHVNQLRQVIGLVVPSVLSEPCSIQETPPTLQLLVAVGSVQFDVNPSVLYTPSILRWVVLPHSAMSGTLHTQLISRTVEHLDVRYSPVQVTRSLSSVRRFLVGKSAKCSTSQEDFLPVSVVLAPPEKIQPGVSNESGTTSHFFYLDPVTPSTLLLISYSFFVIGFFKWIMVTWK